MSTVRINELRVSGRLLRLHQELADPSGPQPVCLYRRLAAERVNIAFLHLDFLRTPGRITCLVAPEAGLFPAEGISMRNGGEEAASPSGAGLVSAFPHRFKPGLIGAVFRALNQGDSRWHCLATSGSILALVADFSSGKRIAEAICRYVDLPEGRAKHCPGQEYDDIARSLKVAPETVARYEESRIRTYGIHLKTGLTICSGYLRPAEMGSWGRLMMDMANSNFCFVYASAAVTAEKGVRMDLVLDLNKQKTGVPEDLMQMPEAPALARLETRKTSEMLSFHGPHFGDRYGIADKAMGCLERSGVPVWMAGCVGATVSLVVPPGMGARGAEALSEIFYTPLRDR